MFGGKVVFVSCLASVLLMASAACFAGQGGGKPEDVPAAELPDAASPVAVDVLAQLLAGTRPPVPSVVDVDGAGSGRPEDVPAADLPDAASPVAVDVLAQLRAGTRPPVPNVVDGQVMGPGGASLPDLPLTASLTAVDVLAQLEAGTIPPVPDVVGSGQGAVPLPGAAVPEPASMTLLALGACASLLAKRRRAR